MYEDRYLCQICTSETYIHSASKVLPIALVKIRGPHTCEVDTIVVMYKGECQLQVALTTCEVGKIFMVLYDVTGWKATPPLC